MISCQQVFVLERFCGNGSTISLRASKTYLEIDEVGQLFHSYVKTPLRLPVLRQDILIEFIGWIH